MKRQLVILISLVAFAVAGVYASVAVSGNTTTPNNSKNHVTICHATGSESNPYVRISHDAEGVISGHVGAGHQNGEDIIPPFDYYADGTLHHFDGQNWDVAHEAIYFNDCNSAEVSTTTTTTEPPPTQTVTVTTPPQVVATPGPSQTVTVTTPGPTTTTTTPDKVVTKIKVVKKTVVKKIHVRMISHKTPRTTG